MDEVTLCAFIAAQLDARFLALDLSRGSRISWPEVAAHMARATGRTWLETDCQRAWRLAAYGEDVGARAELLPDSDGEDDAPQCEKGRGARARGCAAAAAAARRAPHPFPPLRRPRAARALLHALCAARDGGQARRALWRGGGGGGGRRRRARARRGGGGCGRPALGRARRGRGGRRRARRARARGAL